MPTGSTEIGSKYNEQQRMGRNGTKIPLDLHFHWKSRGLLCFVEARLAKKETALRLSSLVNSAGLEPELCKPLCPVDRSKKPLPLPHLSTFHRPRRIKPITKHNAFLVVHHALIVTISISFSFAFISQPPK